MEKFYKAPDNTMHAIEPEFAYMLPDGCVEITDAEADAIRAANVQPPSIHAQIAALEAQITPRRFREAVLTGDHSFIDSVDKQIAALRAKL